MQPDWSRITTSSRIPTLRWAAPADIDRLSCGCIAKPETLNYRTLKPEVGGLFDPDVFGMPDEPVTRANFSAFPDVSLAPKLPPPRFGHIELSTEVVHPLWLTRFDDVLAAELGWQPDELQRVVDYEAYLMPSGEVWSIEQLYDQDDWTEEDAAIGAEAVRQQLERRGRSTRVIIDKVLIIPASLRAVIKVDEGTFITSDLTDLYRRVVNRSNRLRRLIELDAPSIIILNERRMLQEAVEQLFDNGHPTVKVVKRPDGQPLASYLSHIRDSDLAELAAGPLDPGTLSHEAQIAWRALQAMGFEVT